LPLPIPKGSNREAPVSILRHVSGSFIRDPHEQKENMEVDDVKAALIKRYGNYGYGSLPGRVFVEGIKKEAHKAYRKHVLKAGGVKRGFKRSIRCSL
jgi:hypothetical protein